VIAVRVHGVALLPSDDTPVMLLREIAGKQRWLPISIGAPEANALLEAHEHVDHGRPGTIELIEHVIEAFESHVRRVKVIALRDGVFQSDLILEANFVSQRDPVTRSPSVCAPRFRSRWQKPCWMRRRWRSRSRPRPTTAPQGLSRLSRNRTRDGGSWIAA
jgi:bifunctional DNase/RNase